ALRAGIAPADPVLAAVQALARDVVLTRGKVPPTTLEAARQAGLSTAAVLDVGAEGTFAGLVGVVDNLARRVPLDDFPAPRAWAGGPAAGPGRGARRGAPGRRAPPRCAHRGGAPAG